MKRVYFFALIVLSSIQLTAQNTPYKVVFDLTTNDTATHQRVIRWINGIIKGYPDAMIEVVFYGKALSMVESELSTVPEDITKLAKEKNVTFSVCEQAMKVHNVTKNMLLPGVKTVPDALYALISKQAEGYGYIKVVPGGN